MTIMAAIKIFLFYGYYGVSMDTMITMAARYLHFHGSIEDTLVTLAVTNIFFIHSSHEDALVSMVIMAIIKLLRFP